MSNKSDIKGRAVFGALVYHKKGGDKMIPMVLRTIPDILMTIGSSPSCDITIPAATGVAEAQVRFALIDHKSKSSGVYIQNLDPSTGLVKVNGQLLADRQTLEKKDFIEIGRFRFTFKTIKDPSSKLKSELGGSVDASLLESKGFSQDPFSQPELDDFKAKSDSSSASSDSSSTKQHDDAAKLEKKKKEAEETARKLREKQELALKKKQEEEEKRRRQAEEEKARKEAEAKEKEVEEASTEKPYTYAEEPEEAEDEEPASQGTVASSLDFSTTRKKLTFSTDELAVPKKAAEDKADDEDTMETQPEEPVSMICGKCDREPTSAQIKKAMKHCEDCNTWFHARCVNSKGKSFTCIKCNPAPEITEEPEVKQEEASQESQESQETEEVTTPRKSKAAKKPKTPKAKTPKAKTPRKAKTPSKTPKKVTVKTPESEEEEEEVTIEQVRANQIRNEEESEDESEQEESRLCFKSAHSRKQRRVRPPSPSKKSPRKTPSKKKQVKIEEEEEEFEPPYGYEFNSYAIRQQRNPDTIVSQARSNYLKKTTVAGAEQVDFSARLTRSKNLVNSPPQAQKKKRSSSKSKARPKSKSPAKPKAISSRRKKVSVEKEEGRSESELDYPSASEVEAKSDREEPETEESDVEKENKPTSNVVKLDKTVKKLSLSNAMITILQREGKPLTIANLVSLVNESKLTTSHRTSTSTGKSQVTRGVKEKIFSLDSEGLVSLVEWGESQQDSD